MPSWKIKIFRPTRFHQPALYHLLKKLVILAILNTQETLRLQEGSTLSKHNLVAKDRHCDLLVSHLD